MLSERRRAGLKSAINRLGFVVMKHPSPRLVEGHTRMLLDGMGIDCVLDVGANTGQYGRMLRSIGYRGDIVSFEPVGDTYAALRRTIAGDDRWRALPLALGSSDGKAEINVTRGSDMSSLLEALPAGDAPLAETRDVVRTETISTARLDSIWPELPGVERWSRVFLKLDTQGFDLEVLAGAAESLRHVVALQSELSVIPVYRGMPTWLESLERFAALGFEPTGMFPVTVDGTWRTIEFDCLLVRPTEVRGGDAEQAGATAGHG